MSHWKKKEQEKKLSRLHIETKDSTELSRAYEFLLDFKKFKQVDKLYTTYIEGTNRAIEVNKEKKVYPVYNFDGTVTGRLSCSAYRIGGSKSKGVSFHVLPQGENDHNNIRSIFGAPPGWAFITSDYSAMELRVLAHVAKELTMQKAFIDGLDLHSYSASLAFNKPYNSIPKDLRQIAKAVSFLIVYGGTSFTLAKNHGISQAKAESTIQKWMEAYPAVGEYMNHVNSYMLENKCTYTLFGRKRHLVNAGAADPKVVRRAFRQGLNFTIQSTASDIILCAIQGMSAEFKKRKMQARVVATVHDSVEAVCPMEELKETEFIIRDYMIRNPIMTDVFGLSLDIPLETETLIGPSFGQGLEAVIEGGEISNYDEIMEYFNVT